MLPELFRPTVRRKCSNDKEKILKFKADRQEFANILRSLDQFVQVVRWVGYARPGSDSKKIHSESIWNHLEPLRVLLIIPTAICNQERIMNGANTVHCKIFSSKELQGYPVKHWQKPVAFSNYSL